MNRTSKVVLLLIFLFFCGTHHDKESINSELAWSGKERNFEEEKLESYPTSIEESEVGKYTAPGCFIEKSDIIHTRNKILNANIKLDPYPHLVIEGIFTPKIYGCILQNLKPLRSHKILKKVNSKMTPKEIEQAQRSYNDLNSNEHLDRLGEIYGLNRDSKRFWKQFATVLNDDRVRNSWLNKFLEPLSLRSPKFEDKSTRTLSRQLLTIDGSSYAIFPHTDTVDKLVTILIYLPESDDEKYYRLGTLLMQKKNISADLKISGKQRADWKDFSIVKQAPFKPNVALAFSACEESWHAVHKVGKMKEPRISLQTFIMKSNDRTKGKERVGSCS